MLHFHEECYNAFERACTSIYDLNHESIQNIQDASDQAQHEIMASSCSNHALAKLVLKPIKSNKTVKSAPTIADHWKHGNPWILQDDHMSLDSDEELCHDLPPFN